MIDALNENMEIDVIKINAFTDSITGGNPAGVVLDAPILSDEKMKRVTQKINVSETAFVFPSKIADYKLRFFSPKTEVNLCGHATIATFFALAFKGIIKPYNCILRQETKVGILSIDIEFKNKFVKKVMMTQREPLIKNIDFDYEKIADSLNIPLNEIDSNLPKQAVSTGLFTLPICISSYNVLKTINPDFEKIKNLCLSLNVGSFHLFSFETIDPGSVYHARNFAPLYGINEDPVTGTANGAVCSYLLKNNIIKNNSFVCEQGDIINRSGRVFVEINGEIVKVGGGARIVEEKKIVV